jgi:hypothetical protein
MCGMGDAGWGWEKGGTYHGRVYPHSPQRRQPLQHCHHQHQQHQEPHQQQPRWWCAGHPWCHRLPAAAAGPHCPRCSSAPGRPHQGVWPDPDKPAAQRSATAACTCDGCGTWCVWRCVMMAVLVCDGWCWWVMAVAAECEGGWWWRRHEGWLWWRPGDSAQVTGWTSSRSCNHTLQSCGCIHGCV